MQFVVICGRRFRTPRLGRRSKKDNSLWSFLAFLVIGGSITVWAGIKGGRDPVARQVATSNFGFSKSTLDPYTINNLTRRMRMRRGRYRRRGGRRDLED